MAVENDIRVIRVFLASPSDLGDERRAAKSAVDEVNRTIARPNGFHVDLIGWEDTLTGAGRPQAIINEDVATCQMFIGMLWHRWGTPPDDAGRFTSGFEEEFTLASEKNASTGEPRMALFFKDVDPLQLNDPGPEISRVLAFKKRIIGDKKLLFETFEHPTQFEAKVRINIADFIHRLGKRGASPRGEESFVPEPVTETPHDDEADTASADTAAEAAFLAEVAETVAKGRANLTPTQTARLRLIGTAAASSENDEDALGVHDANLLWLSRTAFDLTSREKLALADAGVEASASENKPLWSWLADCMRRFGPWLTYTTLMGPTDRRVGALRVMGMLGTPPVYNDAFGPSRVLSAWFGDKVPASLKNAALEFIGEWGDESMLTQAEAELARNDFGTRNTALDAVLTARGRRSARDAATYAIDASFDSLKGKATSIVLAGMEELDAPTLSKALESRYAPIRMRAVQLLAGRRSIDEATLRKLFNDENTIVRVAAVNAFDELVRELEPSEADAALNRRRPGQSLSAFALGFDLEAYNALNARRRRQLTRLSLHELAEDGPHLTHAEERLGAVAEAHFNEVAPTLRADVDDRFQDFWKRHVAAVRRQYAAGEEAERITALVDKNKEFRIRELIRIALDALEHRRDPRDLARVRRALDDDACDPNANDVDYLGRLGGWEDVARISRMGSRTTATSSLGLLTRRLPLRSASAVLRLSGDRSSELLTSRMTPELLIEVLVEISSARFRSIENDVVTTLLNDENVRVRKAAALRALLSLPTNRVRTVLEAYADPERARFYNVIFWLDLAAAYPQTVYRKIAKLALDRMQLST